MSTGGLFAMGVFVTVIVSIALALPIYGAILDGRDQADRDQPPQAGEDPAASELPEDEKNIVETVRADGSFKTLVAALEAAGLTETLAEEGPFTLFAPTDDAFAELPLQTLEWLLQEPEELAEILMYHVVPGRVWAAEVADLSSAPTVHGDELVIAYAGGIHVSGATVTAPDIEASNGLIHGIDGVLLPSTWLEREPLTPQA